MACSNTNLSDQVSITSGGTPVGPPQDTETPQLVGAVTDSSDAQFDRSPTAQWAAAIDNEEVSHYLLSIAVDDSSGVCDALDFSSPVVDSLPIATSADFSGSGYQAVVGDLDADNSTINFNLKGDTNYCTRVVAVDSSENTSSPIYSLSPWKFFYSSCYEANTNEPTLNDGVYPLDPDGVGGSPSYSAFCDMTTQGGGWTLVIRYDGNEADASNYFLPSGTGQSFINTTDLQSLNGTGNLIASADLVPFIENGATLLMHVGKPDDGATDTSTYVHLYFSEIYQAVLSNPTNIFNTSFDTNSGEGVAGTPVSGVSAIRKDRWFESDMSVMTVFDTDGDLSNNYRIDGGEGDAMFTNGNREGAVYCSGSTSNTEGHGDPKVQWGFAGKDGSSQGYGASMHVGTHCTSNLSCAPVNPINLMFIR